MEDVDRQVWVVVEFLAEQDGRVGRIDEIVGNDVLHPNELEAAACGDLVDHCLGIARVHVAIDPLDVVNSHSAGCIVEAGGVTHETETRGWGTPDLGWDRERLVPVVQRVRKPAVPGGRPPQLCQFSRYICLLVVSSRAVVGALATGSCVRCG